MTNRSDATGTRPSCPGTSRGQRSTPEKVDRHDDANGDVLAGSIDHGDEALADIGQPEAILQQPDSDEQAEVAGRAGIVAAKAPDRGNSAAGDLEQDVLHLVGLDRRASWKATEGLRESLAVGLLHSRQEVVAVGVSRPMGIGRHVVVPEIGVF